MSCRWTICWNVAGSTALTEYSRFVINRVRPIEAALPITIPGELMSSLRLTTRGFWRIEAKSEEDKITVNGALGLYFGRNPCHPAPMPPGSVLKTVNNRSRIFLVGGKPESDSAKITVRQPDFAKLDSTETELLEAVNNARFRYERGECGTEEYDKALRRLNQFAIHKPLRGNGSSQP
jgi:hypothetical protein